MMIFVHLESKRERANHLFAVRRWWVVVVLVEQLLSPEVGVVFLGQDYQLGLLHISFANIIKFSFFYCSFVSELFLCNSKVGIGSHPTKQSTSIDGLVAQAAF